MNRTTLVAGFGLLATASAAFANNSDALNVTAEPAFTIPVLADDHGMHIGARLDLDVNFNSSDTTGGTDDTAGFRRARLMMSGGGTVGYRAVAEFSGGNVQFADLYMTLDNFLVGTLTAGQFFEPFGMENTTYSENITFQERSGATGAVATGRALGFKLSDHMDDMNFGWTVALTSAADANGSVQGLDIEGNWALAARATWAPMMSEDGSNLLHLGASYRMEGADESGIGFEAAYVMGALSLQAELLTATDVNDAAGNDVDGLYLQAAYMLTGETRSYGHGNFGAVTPNSNWNGFGGDGSGALEAAARFSTDTFDATDVDTTTIEVGLNWYMNQSTRLMLGVGTRETDAGGASADAEFVSLRWQLMV
jgi:phosphate-selective porin OprO/OprP